MHRLILSLLLLLALALPAVGANTHGTPTLEQALWFGEALAPYVHTGCTPSVPGASLTLAAFACTGYVRGSAGEFVYVAQAASAVGPLNAGNGTYWLALTRNQSAALGGWTRQVGTHYAWQLAATQPAAPSAGLLVAEVTVAAGAISAVSAMGSPFPVPLSQLHGARSVKEFGARCDGTTDDTRALQRALTAGGTLTLPPGATCLANLVTINSGVLVDGMDMARSLLVSANTHLIIPAGSQLKLDGVRLSSIGKSDVKITGHGSIYCLNQVYVNDAYTGQGGAADGMRACVEFTKTSTTAATGFHLEGLEIYGDGSSTHGAVVGAAKKGKYGVHISVVTNAIVRSCYLHNFDHEALSAAGTNSDVWFIGNRVNNTNSDAINFNSFGMPRSGIVRNYVSGGAPIEASAGIVQGNVLMDSNIGAGGGGAGDIWVLDNQLENGGIDIGVNTGGDTNLTWVITGNTVRNAPGMGIQARDLTGTVRLIDMQNNSVIGWSLSTLGPAFSLILDLSGSAGVFNGNTAEGGPGVAGTAACFSVGGFIGQNMCKTTVNLRPYDVAYSTAQNRGQPGLTPAWVLGSAVVHTGTTVQTQLKAVTIPANFVSFSGCLWVSAQGVVAGVAGTKNMILRYNAIPIAQVTEAAGDTNNWQLQGYACDTGAGTATGIGGIGINGTAIGNHGGGANQPNVISAAGTVEVVATLANAADSVTMYGFFVLPMLGLPMNP